MSDLPRLDIAVSGYELLYLLFFDKDCPNCGADMSRYIAFDVSPGNNNSNNNYDYFYEYHCRGCGRKYKLSDLVKKQFKGARREKS